MRAEGTWERIEAWLRRYAPPMLQTLAPPASDASLDELEAVVGRPLPADLRASYRVHDGQVLDGHGWDASRFLFEDGLWQVADIIQGWAARHDTPREEIDLTLVETHGPIRPGWHSPAWLPFAGGAMHNVMLDLEPPEGGDYGQVFCSTFDEVSNRWLAATLADYLEAFALALEAGLYVFWEKDDSKGIVTVESLQWR